MRRITQRAALLTQRTVMYVLMGGLFVCLLLVQARAQTPTTAAAKPASTATPAPTPAPAAKPAEKSFSADTQARLDALEKQAADLASAKAQVEAAIKANQAEQTAIVWEAAAEAGVKPAELKSGALTIKKNQAGKYMFSPPDPPSQGAPTPTAPPLGAPQSKQ